jgi:DNA-binding SARP family transcriptional activator
VVEVRLLGPVQAVRAGREVLLGGPRQRAVLALLVLEAGRVVPTGRLVEELWRGSPPPGAAVTVRSYVSRLRSALAPEVAVAARGGGYVISVGPDQLDASRFELLVAAGHDALALGRAVAAGARFREALGLWRGPALGDVLEVEPPAREAARLEELRLAAAEARVEADLAAGLHAEVTGELERLVAEHPLRERLWRLLMLALYRDGRQADALDVYRRVRAMLTQELGLEPGEELRQLEWAVLRHEVPPAAPDQPRHNLPTRLTSFVGREDELAAVGKLLDQARLVTLTGPGGAGKTRLAVEFAAGMVDRFGDGVWLADLAGIGDPDFGGGAGDGGPGSTAVRRGAGTGGAPIPAALGGAVVGLGQLRAPARRLRRPSGRAAGRRARAAGPGHQPRTPGGADHATPGQCVNSAVGSCAHAVTASWAIICLAERAQVGGQVGGGGEGVGVVVAQDAAAAVEGVVVQVVGGLHLAQRAQIDGQVGGRVQGVGVVLAQDAAAAGQGFVVQVAGGLHLAQRAQIVGQVVGGVQGVGVVLAQDAAAAGQGFVVQVVGGL